MTTKQKITDRYDQGNLEAATIIASNPTLYPEGSLMSLWADVVLSRAVDSQDAKDGLLAEDAGGRRAA